MPSGSEQNRDDATAHDDATAQIAIIGMACRFPGAGDPDAFWQNLTGGVDSVTRLTRRPVPGRSANGAAPTYVPARGLLTDPEWFDAGYFGYSPREAQIISPQQRVFLECGAEALESAGYDAMRYNGAIGVYAGGTETAYAQILRSQRDSLPAVTDWEILVANGADFLASRLAYKLGLRGPAVTIQAACATALVAVHVAVEALLCGDCDIALAGGAAVHVPAKDSRYTEGGILSANGMCKAFDADADGTVGGDGAGVVVLKPLAAALADGDHIHAVVRGSAVTNDGRDRVGYTAPSVDGQATAIADAHRVAGVQAGSIGYVEAHGTATPLGDPIEIAALSKAFCDGTRRTGFCRIGSVKTNIGHTDAAAGAAGLIKATMAVRHGVIPPSLHFSNPNPEIDFEASPFRVATTLAQWRPTDTPRRAGVSAFGIGGTNAHVVVEEPPERPPTRPRRPWQLLVWSARTPAALAAASARLAAHLRAHPELPLADVAWTLQVGRREHAQRRCAVVSGTHDALHALTSGASDRLQASCDSPGNRPVAFMFPGSADGLQEARRLYREEPEFRRWLDECGESASRQLGADVRAQVRPDRGGRDPALADIAIFAQEYALARLWMKWGVRPAVVLGRGTGTLAAATISGVFRLPDAIHLLLARTRLLRRRERAARAEPAAPGPAQRELEELIRALGPATPQIPVGFASAGRWLAPGEAADPAQLAQNLLGARHRANLERAVSALLAPPGHILVEVGGGHTLARIARSRPEHSAQHLVLATFGEAEQRAGEPPPELAALGRLWLAGTAIDWAGVHDGERPVRVPLPAYPFERQRYVVEPGPAFPAFGSGAEPTPVPVPAAAGAAAPPARSADAAEAGDATETSTLTVVSGLFARHLGLPDVDPGESFFDLGGDSLIAADLLTEVCERLSVDLDLQVVHDAPTVTALAALIDEQLAGQKCPAPAT